MSCLGPWSSTARVFVDIHDACYYQRLCDCPECGLSPGDMLQSRDHTFAGPMPIKEACITTQGNDDIRVQAAADDHFWVPGFLL